MGMLSKSKLWIAVLTGYCAYCPSLDKFCMFYSLDSSFAPLMTFFKVSMSALGHYPIIFSINEGNCLLRDRYSGRFSSRVQSKLKIFYFKSFGTADSPKAAPIIAPTIHALLPASPPCMMVVRRAAE